MIKPDFSQCLAQELRAYILTYRDDYNAIETRIKNRTPNSPTFAFPQTE